MRPKRFDIDVATQATDVMAAALTGAGPWTTADFTLSTTSDGLAHLLSLTSAANLSAITFTIVGTDENGKALTEAVVGPNATTVYSTKYFVTISSITASATVGASTFDVGIYNVASKVVPIDSQSSVACTVAVDVTGTIDFTVQQTFDDIQLSNTSVQSAQWFSITALAAKTADTIGSASVGATAIRFISNSYSAGAEAQMYVSQPKD